MPAAASTGVAGFRRASVPAASTKAMRRVATAAKAARALGRMPAAETAKSTRLVTAAEGRFRGVAARESTGLGVMTEEMEAA